MIATNRILQVTYTLTSLTADVIDNAFDIDRSTGSLIVARELDREQQSEYRLEIRALDVTATNNPQSSAVTIKIEVSDVNDNAPKWQIDPIQINIMENSPIGMPLYNFTATDIDLGPNGYIQYEIVQQMPWNRKTFNVDAITGVLTHLSLIDFEELNEYLLVVKAMDQSVNTTERLSTLVTARISVIDVNDNTPIFVSPSSDNAIIYVSETQDVGEIFARLIAIDKDSGNNGVVNYAIINGNEDNQFELDAFNGTLKLLKPIWANVSSPITSIGNGSNRKYILTISASDNGFPNALATQINVQIVVQGLSTNPPKFKESIYYVNISENVPIGTFVVRVGAKSFHSESGKFFVFSLYL